MNRTPRISARRRRPNECTNKERRFTTAEPKTRRLQTAAP
jgi:hypothetical protein